MMKFSKIDQGLTDLMERKNKAYGNAYSKNFKDFGIIYSAIEVRNKTERIVNLIKHEESQANNESLFDSFVDLRNYAELAVNQMIENRLVSEEDLEKYGLLE